MKVSISLEGKDLDDVTYSKIIEWPFELLPEKGDILSVVDSGLLSHDGEEMNRFNDWVYSHKMFLMDENEIMFVFKRYDVKKH